MPTEKDPDAIVPGLYAAGEAACASVSEIEKRQRLKCNGLTGSRS